MQHNLHLQTQFLFGNDRLWTLLDPLRFPILKLSSHLQDQVLRILLSAQPYGMLVECQVAEQCPKDSYCQIVRGLRSFHQSALFVNIVHCRSTNAHAIFWRESQPDRYHHLDLDFTKASELDRKVLEQLHKPASASRRELFELLEGRNQAEQFFHTLERHLNQLDEHQPSARHALVDLLLKLIFLIFVERKGWLNFDHHYLEHRMDFCQARGLSIIHTFLTPLFARLEGGQCREYQPMGELPRLGGGMFLFQPELLPRIHNDWCLELISQLLARFSFSLFEGHSGRNVVGIGPEIMGHVFENLLSSDDRRATGTYYTPSALAEKQVEASLNLYLDRHRHADHAEMTNILSKLRVFDPTCGSGAYLMAAFRALLKRRLQLAPESARYNGQLFALKQQIVVNNLFGLDINPLAVRLTEVRLWLNMIQDLEISRPQEAPALPSLQHHIRTGDFIRQYHPKEQAILKSWPKLAQLERIRSRFPSTDGTKRAAVLRNIQRLESELLNYLQEHDYEQERQRIRAQTAQTSLPDVESSVQWKKPKSDGLSFSPQIFFSSAMLDGGFDLILGNPPWLSASKTKAHHRTRIRNHPTPDGLELKGQTDLSCHFLASAILLLKQGGSLSFLLPAKLLQARYGSSLRTYLANRMRIDYLFDFGVEQGIVFEADTFPLALGISALPVEPGHRVILERHSRQGCEHGNFLQSDYANLSGAWPSLGQKINDWEQEPSLRLCQMGLRVHRGIVTGNKRTFVRDSPPPGWQVANWQRLLRGRDFQYDRVLSGSQIYNPFRSSSEIPNFEPIERAFLENEGLLLKGNSLPKLRYRIPRLKGWLLIWKYLSTRWEVHLLPAGDWLPDQTCYYIPLSNFTEAYRLFLFFNSEQAREWLDAHAERGKDRCLFYYAHTIEALPIPIHPTFETIGEPKTRQGLTPIQAEGLWHAHRSCPSGLAREAQRKETESIQEWAIVEGGAA